MIAQLRKCLYLPYYSALAAVSLMAYISCFSSGVFFFWFIVGVMVSIPYPGIVSLRIS
jgi:hypothetical protein